MEGLLIIPILIGFFVSFISLPFWLRRARNVGLVWEDMHKKGTPKNVVGSGGISVLLGFTIGVLSYIAIQTFIFDSNVNIIQIFALLTTILIAGAIGFIDDFLGWVHGGLSNKLRIFLVLIAAIPLMVINAGESIMMGIPLGWIYPLILIPLGIVATTTTFNMIAGYNGLEASQGMIFLVALAVVTYITRDSWLTILLLTMISSIFAFYIFNKNPAKVFPGDVLTYPVGAFIGIVAILGNIEKIAIWFFIPYILEVGLKLRGGLRKQSFGKLEEDGNLAVPYEKFYGVEHIAIYLLRKWKIKASENNVVRLINLFQIVIIILGFLFFGGELFLK